jgi:hypothetical protein
MLINNNIDYQQELLKIIPPNLSEENIKEIKKILVKYFASKVNPPKIWKSI